MGRPLEPVPADKAEFIIQALYCGRTLTSTCKELGISVEAVQCWRAKDETFHKAFARAREAGAEAMVDEAQDISDSATPEEIQVAKLRADVRQRRAANFCPRVFGTKVQVGGDGGKPIRIVDKAKAEQELAAILANAAQRVAEPDGS